MIKAFKIVLTDLVVHKPCSEVSRTGPANGFLVWTGTVCHSYAALIEKADRLKADFLGGIMQFPVVNLLRSDLL